MLMCTVSALTLSLILLAARLAVDAIANATAIHPVRPVTKYSNADTQNAAREPSVKRDAVAARCLDCPAASRRR